LGLIVAVRWTILEYVPLSKLHSAAFQLSVVIPPTLTLYRPFYHPEALFPVTFFFSFLTAEDDEHEDGAKERWRRWHLETFMWSKNWG